MKSCFSTLGCSDRALDGILSLANKYNISSLEFRGIGGILDGRLIPEFSEDRLPETYKKISDAGLTVAVIGTSCSFHDGGEKLPGVIDEGIRSAEIASALGAEYIRVFGNRIKNEHSTENVISGIAELCDRITGNTKVLLEVHGDFNTCEALAPVCSSLKDRKFGLIWDICHTDEPYGDNWESFYSEFSGLIKHVHVKDKKRGGALCLPGEGDLPVRDILKRLKSDGFDGCISLEWEKKWHKELPEIEPALEAYLAQVSEFLN